SSPPRPTRSRWSSPIRRRRGSAWCSTAIAWSPSCAPTSTPNPPTSTCVRRCGASTSTPRRRAAARAASRSRRSSTRLVAAATIGSPSCTRPASSDRRRSSAVSGSPRSTKTSTVRWLQRSVSDLAPTGGGGSPPPPFPEPPPPYSAKKARILSGCGPSGCLGSDERLAPRPVQLRELARARRQLGRRAVLDDPPVLHDEHAVGDLDGRQAVRDDDRRAVGE